ncbi:12270_t:CDS:2, partial [Acaulospora colombiana]
EQLQAIQFHIPYAFFYIISINNSNNMFSHLCMKYIFFLLAITTIVAGMPLEETRNFPLEETQNLSLSRRDLNMFCPDPHFPKWISSNCRSMDVVANTCEAPDSSSNKIFYKLCPLDYYCIDFIRPHDPTPFAACVSKSKIDAWNNHHARGKFCAPSGGFKTSKRILTFGMTTYDAKKQTTKVNMMDVTVNNKDLGTIHLVTAVAAALSPDELTVL